LIGLLGSTRWGGGAAGRGSGRGDPVASGEVIDLGERESANGKRANFQPAPPADEPWNRPGPPDLDCADIGHRVEIDGPDYHRLDRDGDGTGCDDW
jgi:hypothetical protein